MEFGDDQQTADILTRAHSSGEIHELVTGSQEAVDALAAFAGR